MNYASLLSTPWLTTACNYYHNRQIGEVKRNENKTTQEIFEEITVNPMNSHIENTWNDEWVMLAAKQSGVCSDSPLIRS